MFNKTQLKKILEDYNIRPKKNWGQNFLIDKNINNKILKVLDTRDDDIIIEIGAGFGNLTMPMAESAYKVYAVEKDEKIAHVLKKKLSGFKNIYLITDDFLKIDLRKILKNKISKTIKVVGNLPYYISSPVIFRLLEYRKKIDFALIMLQKEVATRILAQPPSKDYGILSCLTNVYLDTQKMINISKNSFYPRPKVDSSLIKMKFLNEPRFKIDNEELFFRVVKAAFSKRRKHILNALFGYSNLKFNKQIVKLILDELHIDYKKRAEELYLEDFVRISNLFNKKFT